MVGFKTCLTGLNVFIVHAAWKSKDGMALKDCTCSDLSEGKDEELMQLFFCLLDAGVGTNTPAQQLSVSPGIMAR